MASRRQEQKIQNEELIQIEELDQIEEEQEIEINYLEEEEKKEALQKTYKGEEEEEEEKDDNSKIFEHAETLYERHKVTLDNYLKSKSRKDAAEIKKYIETEPPKYYESQLKIYGPSLVTNTSKIEELNRNQQNRNDFSQPEKMTNDQLRSSIRELAINIQDLNNDIETLKDSIKELEVQYVEYQKKKKERDMAQLSAHAKKSKSPKSKTAASPSPKKTTKK